MTVIIIAALFGLAIALCFGPEFRAHNRRTGQSVGPES